MCFVVSGSKSSQCNLISNIRTSIAGDDNESPGAREMAVGNDILINVESKRRKGMKIVGWRKMYGSLACMWKWNHVYHLMRSVI